MRFGIEYTFVHPTLSSLTMVALRLEYKGFTRAHVDPNVVEVPSPPHASLDEAKWFFDRLGRAVGLEGLVPRIMTVKPDGTEEYRGTGGGHVHVGVPENRTQRVKIYQQLIPFMANRPWLNWVFNEFCDSENANSLWYNYYCRGYMLKRSSYDMNQWDNIKRIVADNDYAIRYGNEGQTVEFRIFDMPRSWQQVTDHVDIAVGIMQYMDYRIAKGLDPEPLKVPVFTEGSWSTEDPDYTKQYTLLRDVRVPFKKLCKTLGLSWRRYSKYMQNYKDRLAFGELT